MDTLFAAKALLGKYIVRVYENKKLVMKITETEAYIGKIDKACHAYNNKKTERTKVLFNKGGCAYIYLIYGLYYCFNVVTEKKDEPCAILIRGGQPYEGLEIMSKFRYNKSYDELSKYQIKNFSNGPGKLCKALNITKKLNNKSLLGNNFYIYDSEENENINIKTSKRININYAEEAIDFMWRFYI